MKINEIDALEAYRLPLEVAKGTWITVPGTKVRVFCTLPSRYNEDFQMAWFARLDGGIPTNAEGMPDITQLALSPKASMRGAFLQACVKGVDGMPDDMTVAEFAETYPLALDAVLSEARELATAVDERVKSALGNLLPSSSAPRSGAETSGSTKTSKNAASSKKAISSPS